jgi:hypothetical protein
MSIVVFLKVSLEEEGSEVSLNFSSREAVNLNCYKNLFYHRKYK